MNIFSREKWDKNRGLQHSSFSEVLKRTNADLCPSPCSEELGEGGVRRWLGTDIMDPYGSQVKPKNVPVWNHPPMTPAEEAIYWGVHIHSESNPTGLHTHVKGGKLGGGHSHGPQNRFGSHHHRTDVPKRGGISVDGSHVHDGENCPAGQHNHVPENFG